MPDVTASASTPDTQPVRLIPTDADEPGPQPGLGLCLSGGGYRAMLFHLGSLWRLNEAGYLPRLRRISSVSGGSITAGVLGLHWSALNFDAQGVGAGFVREVVQPIRDLADRTIDAFSIVGGLLLPGSVADKVAGAYRSHLFGHATLQDLPDDAHGPRFVINATSVQTGSLFRFSRPFMADWRVGQVRNPTVELAVAVAASSAFPPVLSPLVLRLDEEKVEPLPGATLHREPYTQHAVLSDGGVYDNLGLETVWKKCLDVLVSDGGAGISPQEEPEHDWARHSIRVIELINNQVRALRKRQVIGSYGHGGRGGTYWGTETDISNYPNPGPLGPQCPYPRTLALAATPTRLQHMDDGLQERLINWGYAVCDAALRSHVDTGLPAPTGFPYPSSGV